MMEYRDTIREVRTDTRTEIERRIQRHGGTGRERERDRNRDREDDIQEQTHLDLVSSLVKDEIRRIFRSEKKIEK